MRTKPVIGIDGPAGAGKGTTAKLVAKTLGYIFIDTGALFRAVTLACEQGGIEVADERAVTALATRLVAENRLRLEADEHQAMRVILNNEAPGELLRSRRISQLVPVVSTYAGVRDAVLIVLRAFGTEGGIVMEGRDICTIVFPDAEVKIYLTASPEVRAQRRVTDLASRGEHVNYDDILADVRTRDDMDMNRPIAPLRQAEDAIFIDSDNLTIEQVVEQIVAIAKIEEETLR